MCDTCAKAFQSLKADLKKATDQNEELRTELENVRSQLKMEKKRSEKMKKVFISHNIAIPEVCVCVNDVTCVTCVCE